MYTPYIRPTAKKITLHLEGTILTHSLTVSSDSEDTIEDESQILTRQKNSSSIWD